MKIWVNFKSGIANEFRIPMIYQKQEDGSYAWVQDPLKKNDRKFSKASDLEVKLPSAVGNWNSCVKVPDGEAKLVNICVEDYVYLVQLQKDNHEDKTSRVANDAYDETDYPNGYLAVADPKNAAYDTTDATYISSFDSSNLRPGMLRADGTATVAPYFVQGSNNPYKATIEAVDKVVYYTEADADYVDGVFTPTGTPIDLSTSPFGDAYVWKFWEDKEIIRDANTNSSVATDTAPRYGSLILGDDGSFVVYREDNTWGNFPKEEGTQKVYYAVSTDGAEPTTFSSSVTLDDTTPATITVTAGAQTHVFLLVENGSPLFGVTESVSTGTDDPTPVEREFVREFIAPSDVKAKLYKAAVLATTDTITLTVVDL